MKTINNFLLKYSVWLLLNVLLVTIFLPSSSRLRLMSSIPPSTFCIFLTFFITLMHPTHLYLTFQPLSLSPCCLTHIPYPFLFPLALFVILSFTISSFIKPLSSHLSLFIHFNPFYLIHPVTPFFATTYHPTPHSLLPYQSSVPGYRIHPTFLWVFFT